MIYKDTLLCCEHKPREIYQNGTVKHLAAIEVIEPRAGTILTATMFRTSQRAAGPGQLGAAMSGFSLATWIEIVASRLSFPA